MVGKISWWMFSTRKISTFAQCMYRAEQTCSRSLHTMFAVVSLLRDHPLIQSGVLPALCIVCLWCKWMELCRSGYGTSFTELWSTTVSTSFCIPLHWQRRLRMVLVEGALGGWVRAQNVLHLLDEHADSSEVNIADIIEAVRNCGDLKRSRSFLQQECQACFCIFPATKVSWSQSSTTYLLITLCSSVMHFDT